MRLDPRSRFVLAFVARMEARSITTIVERAIQQYADRVVVGPEWDDRGNKVGERTWADYWDPSEGVRTLKMLADRDVPTTFEDDELRAFVVAHQPFFYQDRDCQQPQRVFVEILWPEIERFLEVWRTQKATDYWAAGEQMKARLLAAKVKPPEWPPAVEPDDDIPF